jgi:hypothetical protein
MVRAGRVWGWASRSSFGVRDPAELTAKGARTRISSRAKKREWPDGPNKEFLKNLLRLDNHKFLYRDKHSLSCCDAGDTVKTKFKIEREAEESIQRMACMHGLTTIG